VEPLEATLEGKRRCATSIDYSYSFRGSSAITHGKKKGNVARQMRELLRSKLTAVREIGPRERPACGVIAITRSTPRIHEIPVFVPLKDTLRNDVHDPSVHAREAGENRFRPKVGAASGCR
jgi:hypothetical protein